MSVWFMVQNCVYFFRQKKIPKCLPLYILICLWLYCLVSVWLFFGHSNFRHLLTNNRWKIIVKVTECYVVTSNFIWDNWVFVPYNLSIVGHSSLLLIVLDIYHIICISLRLLQILVWNWYFFWFYNIFRLDQSSSKRDIGNINRVELQIRS